MLRLIIISTSYIANLYVRGYKTENRITAYVTHVFYLCVCLLLMGEHTEENSIMVEGFTLLAPGCSGLIPRYASSIVLGLARGGVSWGQQFVSEEVAYFMPVRKKNRDIGILQWQTSIVCYCISIMLSIYQPINGLTH